MGYRFSLAVVLVLASSLRGEVNARDVYQTIRQNDLARLKSFLDSGMAVDLRDSRGNTPLMHAAAIGSVEAMQLLMKAGADVNAKNGLDATPLIWGASNPQKASLLMEAGAAVHARTKMGRTPLMMAASSPGSSSTVQQMLAKGADASAADVRGNTALVDAARADNLEAVAALVEHKADLDAGDFAGLTALSYAASHSNLRMMRLLLNKGANVNASLKREMKVRNGLIAASHLTALMIAVSRSSAETVALLLDSGADVHAKDVRGMTPLMLATASDVASPKVIRLLLDKGSDPTVKSVDGETALDWARKFGNPQILAMLGGRLPEKKMAVQPARTTGKDPRRAVERALPLLQSSVKEYFRMSGCAGCHHQHVIGMAVPAATRKGVTVDEAFARDQVQLMKSESTGSREAMLQDIFISADGLVFGMLGMSELGYAPDDLTDAMVSAIAARQNQEGSWMHLPLVRPPLEDSPFVTAALSVRALQRYMIPARRVELEGRIAKAKEWFTQTMPVVPYERSFQVMGLHWAGADRQTVNRAVAELRKLQQPDGGWPQVATLGSDAFGTAVALYALMQAGMSPREDAYQRGIRYLLQTQLEDGSWHVASRAPKVQPYFQSGFPHGHDQWISAAATAWAVTVLSDAMQPARQTAALQPR